MCLLNSKFGFDDSIEYERGGLGTEFVCWGILCQVGQFYMGGICVSESIIKLNKHLLS